jgi:hypothetical protein
MSEPTVEIVCDDQNILLQQDVSVVEISPEYYEVTVSAVGERGPASTVPGPPGPQGPSGPPGVTGGAQAFIQNTAQSTWTITHALSYNPNISIVDSGGTQVEGRVQYLDATTILATFSSAISGIAYLS